jgi:hypothetical protein
MNKWSPVLYSVSVRLTETRSIKVEYSCVYNDEYQDYIVPAVAMFPLVKGGSQVRINVDTYDITQMLTIINHMLTQNNNEEYLIYSRTNRKVTICRENKSVFKLRFYSQYMTVVIDMSKKDVINFMSILESIRSSFMSISILLINTFMRWRDSQNQSELVAKSQYNPLLQDPSAITDADDNMLATPPQQLFSVPSDFDIDDDFKIEDKFVQQPQPQSTLQTEAEVPQQVQNPQPQPQSETTTKKIEAEVDSNNKSALLSEFLKALENA